MPRKAPSNVEEVRHTFGNLERQQIAQLTEATVKATRLKSYASVAGNAGLLVMGGGVVAAAAFFGIGYAGTTLRDLVSPVVDWAQDKSAAIAGGENVEKIEEAIVYEQQQVDKWTQIMEDNKRGSGGSMKLFFSASYKAANHKRKLEILKKKLVAAKAQQKMNQSGVPSSLFELLGGGGWTPPDEQDAAQ
jgi:hypothetical protein